MSLPPGKPLSDHHAHHVTVWLHGPCHVLPTPAFPPKSPVGDQLIFPFSHLSEGNSILPVSQVPCIVFFSLLHQQILSILPSETGPSAPPLLPSWSKPSTTSPGGCGWPLSLVFLLPFLHPSPDPISSSGSQRRPQEEPKSKPILPAQSSRSRGSA